MDASAENAMCISLLFNYGVVSGAEVIKWAEDRISENESPSNALLELAWTSPTDTTQIISQLIVLTSGADIYVAFRKALGQLYDYVTLHPSTAERITSRLLGTLMEINHDARGREFYFLYRCSDDFESVRQGEYVSRATVLEFLRTELQKYVKSAD